MSPEPRGPAGHPLLTRRTFLVGSAAFSGAVLLASCGSRRPTASTDSASGGVQLASPEHPVTWTVPAGSEPIAAGLEPERNATLKLYNWAEYINMEVVTDFQKKYKQYGVKVQVSTFNTMEEALAKLRSGRVEFDVFFPTYDRLGKLVQAGYLRALTHDYVPNISQVWPEFSNPFYDQGWKFSVPYTVYSTGIAWRADKVTEDIGKRPNPYDVFWDTRYKGRIGILDDYREAIGMALLRNGVTDLNTGDQAQLDKARDQLVEMANTVNPVVNTKDYINLPEGRVWVTQAWSGDMVNAQYYMPKGQSADVMRYWFPDDSKGPVNNDLMVLLKSGKNPVLGHLFLNYLLDNDVALKNMSFNGYQPPQNKVTPAQLVTDEYIPTNLESAIVDPQDVAKGLRELELPPDVDARWQRVWQQFKAGA